MIKKTLFFGSPCYLSVANSQLVISQRDESSGTSNKTSRPIEDIGMIILESREITITAPALDALIQNNCSVVTCDKKCMPSGLLLPLECNTLQSERFSAQIESSLPLKKRLWQQTVKAKIANQSAVLKENGVEAGCMDAWSKDVKSGDPNNLEARSAAYYWRNVFHDPDFIRGKDGFPPNNLLNYGYAILRAVVARALIGSGLLPTFGIHHHNRYNAFCLADDIMEPYRPYVDKVVIFIMDVFDPQEIMSLSKSIKTRLLTIPTIDVTLNGTKSPLMVASTLTAASLTKCYNGEATEISYPRM